MKVYDGNEELRVLRSSPNIIRMIKSRRMVWAEHIVFMENIRNVYKILNWMSVSGCYRNSVSVYELDSSGLG